MLKQALPVVTTRLAVPLNERPNYTPVLRTEWGGFFDVCTRDVRSRVVFCEAQDNVFGFIVSERLNKLLGLPVNFDHRAQLLIGLANARTLSELLVRLDAPSDPYRPRAWEPLPTTALRQIIDESRATGAQVQALFNDFLAQSGRQSIIAWSSKPGETRLHRLLGHLGFAYDPHVPGLSYKLVR